MKGHNKGCGLLPDLFGKGGKSCFSSLVRQLKQKGFEKNDGDKGYADPSNEGRGSSLSGGFFI